AFCRHADPRCSPRNEVCISCFVEGARESSRNRRSQAWLRQAKIRALMFRQKGAEYFDPDEVAERVLAANPGVPRDEANGTAWNEGKRLLERAIDNRCGFAFETTLGGRTIAALLEKALS